MDNLINETLKNSFMLVKFYTRSVPKTRQDVEATKAALDSQHANRGAGKFNKYLWAGADAEVKAIDAEITNARKTFFAYCQPWTPERGIKTNEGILQNDMFFDFIRDVNQHVATLNGILDGFELVYEARVQQAMVGLGNMADRNLYPSFESLRDRVTLKFKYDAVPLPENSSNLQLPGQIVDKIVANNTAAQQDMVANAMRTAQENVITVVQRIVKATDGEKGRKVYASNFDQLPQLVRALKAYNVTNDPAVASAHAELEKLVVYGADDVRKNDNVREFVHTTADRAVSAMGSIWGGESEGA